MNDIVTTSITPLSNTERLIRWRAEYTRLTADVDDWLRVIGRNTLPDSKGHHK